MNEYDRGRRGVGAVVLCGGVSRRLGIPKETIRLGGITLLERTVRLARAVADDVIVAARSDQTLPELPPFVTVVRDGPGRTGPLAGIEAGLAALRPGGAAFVLACDHPFLKIEVLHLLLSRLTDDVDACVPRTGGGLEPLLALYRTDALETCRWLLDASERRAGALVGACRSAVIDEDSLRAADRELLSFRDVDEPMALEWAQAAFADEARRMS